MKRSIAIAGLLLFPLTAAAQQAPPTGAQPAAQRAPQAVTAAAAQPPNAPTANPRSDTQAEAALLDEAESYARALTTPVMEQLDARRKLLDDQAAVLNARAAALNQQEQALRDREASLAAREQALAASEAAAAQVQATLVPVPQANLAPNNEEPPSTPAPVPEPDQFHPGLDGQGFQPGVGSGFFPGVEDTGNNFISP